MCGISVYLGSNKELSKVFISRSNRLLYHRGPDDLGEYFDEKIGLGHTRLSIQDLSTAGHQPMISRDKRYVLVFNGEIYNHQELRTKYLGNHVFEGHSDTETLLQLLIQFGVKALEMMIGMWAFAFWDKQKNQLLVCRDRYGQKPLYYRHLNGSLLFASEIKSLILKNESPTGNRRMIAEYLATGNYGHLGKETFYDGVYQLLPGHFSFINTENVKIEQERYWRFPTRSFKEQEPFDEAMQSQFRELLYSSVKMRLLSDVPVGATLSGGIDSSAVVSLMSNLISEPFDVFTAQARGSTKDESRFVKSMQDKYSEMLKMHWYESGELNLGEDLLNTIRSQEEPFGDPSIMAQLKLMNFARENGVKVILGGQGADELLFGYPFMFQALVSTALRTGNFKWAVQEGRKMRLSYPSWLRCITSFLNTDLESTLRSKRRKLHGNWLSEEFQIHLNGSHLNSSPADLNSVWLEAIEKTALPHLVHYDDRNSMANSIEGRMPFLDHRLAELVSSIEPFHFYKNGYSKIPLRNSFRTELPEDIIHRTDKIGFYTPLQCMMISERDRIFELLSSEEVKVLVFDVKTLQTSLDRIEIMDVYSLLRVFRLISVIYWMRTFNIRGFA